MKPADPSSLSLRHVLLSASLVLNASLAAIFFTEAVANRRFSTRTRTVEVSVPSSSGRRVSELIDPSASQPGPGTWALLNTGDLSTREARLRELGFPPSLARSIMVAQIRTLYAPRLRELEMIFQRSPYFRPKALNEEAFAEFRALSREENRRIRELLGPDRSSASAQNIRNALPGTSEEKITQLTDLMSNYDQLRKEFTAINRGTPLTPDEREQMMGLEKSLRAEMAALLTPRELEDYDLRTSGTANNLRTTLAGIDVTEEEFRALFRIQNAANQQVSTFGGANFVATLTPMVAADNIRAVVHAREQMLGQIANTLGPELFAAYQRASDFGYRQTAQLVARLELPPETATQVYTVQQDLQQRAQAIQTNRTLSPEDRNAQLSALASEAQTKVTTALGAPGYEAYKQYGGGWMGILQPRPANGSAVNGPVFIRN
jgi:hypothetical protein